MTAPYLTPTTLEFRKVVRKVAKEQGLSIYDSYTNTTSVAGSHRTVGFDIGGASAETAALIELELNNKGFAAWTRCLDGGATQPSGCARPRWATYIRGTCVIE
jgi:hypothetical protein